MRFLVFLLAICSVVSAPAKVVLSSLFTDNMVLQQQTDVQIWGMALRKRFLSVLPGIRSFIRFGRMMRECGVQA